MRTFRPAATILGVAATAALITTSTVIGGVLGADQVFAIPVADGSNIVTVTPTRVLDSRAGTEVGLAGRFQSRTNRKLQVTGVIDVYLEGMPA